MYTNRDMNPHPKQSPFTNGVGSFQPQPDLGWCADLLSLFLLSQGTPGTYLPSHAIYGPEGTKSSPGSISLGLPRQQDHNKPGRTPLLSPPVGMGLGLYQPFQK